MYMRIFKIFTFILTVVFMSYTNLKAETEPVYIKMDISGVYNNDGIAPEVKANDGNFDYKGFNYTASMWPDAGETKILGIPFTLPDKEDGRNNNIACNGQEIEVPEGRYASIFLLCSATKDKAEEEVKLKFKDGSISSAQLNVTFWNQEPQYNEKKALEFCHNMSPAGLQYLFTYIFLQKIPAGNSKVLMSIILPDEPNIHIFSITLEK